MSDDGQSRIARIAIDEASLAATSAVAESDRRAAIDDLLAANHFALPGKPSGPYDLRLSTADDKLILDVRDLAEQPVMAIGLSLKPFRRIIRDYFMICESYHDAVRTATPDKIQAIDMGRRGLHNEGSDLLIERLEGKVEMDFDTARRLFTLVCALHRSR